MTHSPPTKGLADHTFR